MTDLKLNHFLCQKLKSHVTNDREQKQNNIDILVTLIQISEYT